MTTTGSCPWCRRSMEVGDEDPILERICDDCSDVPLAELFVKNPVAGRTYREARIATMVDVVPARHYGANGWVDGYAARDNYGRLLCTRSSEAEARSVGIDMVSRELAALCAEVV